MSKFIVLGAAAIAGAAALCPICGSGVSTAAATSSVPMAADTAKARLTIRGMTCGSCATTARIALERVPGVYSARVSYDSASAVVLYDPARTSPDQFMTRLKDMTGYEPALAGESEPPKEGQ